MQAKGKKDKVGGRRQPSANTPEEIFFVLSVTGHTFSQIGKHKFWLRQSTKRDTTQICNMFQSKSPKSINTRRRFFSQEQIFGDSCV